MDTKYVIKLPTVHMLNIGSAKYAELSQVSVNDIQDKYFAGVRLNNDEKSALFNFEKFRVSFLSAAGSKLDFEQRYYELRVRAGLWSYLKFLA